jgi:Fic family protein
MARPIQDQGLHEIEEILRSSAGGMTAQEIAEHLTAPLPRRTLQYRLKYLVDNNRVDRESEGRWARYRVHRDTAGAAVVAGEDQAPAEVSTGLSLSKSGGEVQAAVRRPIEVRRPVGYNRAVLETYRPNESAYLSESERDHLRKVGTPLFAQQPAGTYAKQILSRLLIDLSWNSSRLEGNTYSLLDTRRLIDFGEAAEGKERREAQMILNHKDAIEFLVSAADDIGFNRYTILNLHALLANNLLADPRAAGRLRHIGVGIERSVFHPLEAPQLIEECFDQLLATASAIIDPFEQALFVMVQLPYLQPFDDVNKRVSRLASNIPLVRQNLSPLSFVDVPSDAYTDAELGVYELNRVDLLKDVFIWAYERSAERYAAIRQSLGEPDPFRLRYRDALREIIGAIVRGQMDRKKAIGHIRTWTQVHIDTADRGHFQEAVEEELLGLHEGNFARYQIRPSEFKAWRDIWSG